MARKIIIGIMGPGRSAPPSVKKLAFEIGRLVAAEGWIVLTGGVNQGVMDMACRGAKRSGGTTIGIISRPTVKISSSVDIPIMTDMGRARNNINAMTSDAIVVCGMGGGTASEVAFAIQAKKPVVFIAAEKLTIKFFKRLEGKYIHAVKTPSAGIKLLRKIIVK